MPDMPIRLSDYFVSHPTIPTKETCKACLSHLQAKKEEIQNDKHSKESQRRNELLKKDGQSKLFLLQEHHLHRNPNNHSSC